MYELFVPDGEVDFLQADVEIQTREQDPLRGEGFSYAHSSPLFPANQCSS